MTLDHRWRSGLVLAFDGHLPELGECVFVAPGAVVCGKVRLGDHASVWFGAVLRGDVNYVQLGAWANIQDGAVLHVTRHTPLVAGDWLTVGHRAVVHGCTLGSGVLIGMGAVVLDNVVLGDGVLVAAGAVVSPGTKAPDGAVLMGVPARVVRIQDQAARDAQVEAAVRYADLAAQHALSMSEFEQVRPDS